MNQLRTTKFYRDVLDGGKIADRANSGDVNDGFSRGG
jgi:hypothetical protein